jgi:ribosomal protein L37E
MARLVRCRDCGQSISRRARLCLACGAPNRRRMGPLGWAAVALAAFATYSVVMAPARMHRDGAIRPVAAPRAAVPNPPALLPEVAAFLAGHPEFGAATSAQAMPDWAKGRRQRVALDSGRNLLLYAKGGAVTAAYEDGPEGRVKVWGGFESD